MCSEPKSIELQNHNPECHLNIYHQFEIVQLEHINDLDIHEYCVGYGLQKTVYNLYAICNHDGGVGSGHVWLWLLPLLLPGVVDLDDLVCWLLDRTNWPADPPQIWG